MAARRRWLALRQQAQAVCARAKWSANWRIAIPRIAIHQKFTPGFALTDSRYISSEDGEDYDDEEEEEDAEAEGDEDAEEDADGQDGKSLRRVCARIR